MRANWKQRLLAWILCAASLISLVPVGAVSRPGAGGDTSGTGKPKLLIDFMGGNAATPQTPVLGLMKDATWKYPADTDVTNKDKIFWVGVGIDQLDNFVLANQKDGAANKGIFSLELGLYYDPAFVRPYTGTAATDTSYRAVLEQYNLGANNSQTQWKNTDYDIISAVSAADPHNANTAAMVNDPSTQEFAPRAGWKMTHVTLRKTTTGANRFSDAVQNGGKYPAGATQYVMMIPFVLVSTVNPSLTEPCIRLARNASAFAMGGGEKGDTVYGTWDKFTQPDGLTHYTQPEHNLKLMLDFGGDLNIFAGERQDKTYTAGLTLNTAGKRANTADLSIWRDGEFTTAQPHINQNGDALTGLTAGTRMQLKVTCASGFKVNVKATAADGTVLLDKQGLTSAAAAELADLQFTMPEGNVTVSVLFEPNAGEATLYDVNLHIVPATPAVGNEVKMTSSLSATDSAAADGQKLSLRTTLPDTATPTKVTIATKVHSEYDVKVEVKYAGNTGTVLMDPPVAGQYKFDMVPSDLDVTVTFTPATKYQAKLVVTDAEGAALATKNSAKLSYTTKEGGRLTTDAVTAGYVDTTPGDGLSDAIDLRENWVATVTPTIDPAYEVQEVLVSPQVAGAFTPFRADRHAANKNFTFPMPAFAANVTMTVVKTKLYTLELVKTGRELSSATGSVSFVDAYGVTQTASATGGTLQVPKDAVVTVLAGNAPGSVTLAVGNTETPNNPPLPTNIAGGWTFTMPALVDQTQKIVATLTYADVPATIFTATLHPSHADSSPVGSSNVQWPGTNLMSLTASPGDLLTANITVAAGYYVQSATITTKPADAALPTLKLPGNGYNNGAGGSLDLSFAMPNADGEVYLVFAKGPPPKEPELTATLVVVGDNAPAGAAPSVVLTNGTGGGSTDLLHPSLTVHGGDKLTGQYTKPAAAAALYIEKIEVIPTVVGVTGDYEKTGEKTFGLTMPAASVVVRVTLSATKPPQHILTCKHTPANGGNSIVEVPSNINPPSPVDWGTAVTIKMYPQDETKWYLDSIVVREDGQSGAGRQVPVTLRRAGIYTYADFYMPNADCTAQAVFVQSSEPEHPTHPLTLAVTGADAASLGNSATASIEGVTPPVVQTGDGAISAPAVQPGALVSVTCTAVAGYTVDGVSLAPFDLDLIPQVGTGPSYQFIMPNEPVTATVHYRKTAAPAEYTANLVIYGPGSGDGSFGNSPDAKKYSLRAKAGDIIDLALLAQTGSYLDSLTVVPTLLGVSATQSGVYGRQSGSFVMPNADCQVNAVFRTGWPDAAPYGATLAVTDAGQSAGNHAKLSAPGAATVDLSHGQSGMIAAAEGTRLTVDITKAQGSSVGLTVNTADGTPLPYTWETAVKASFVMPDRPVRAAVTYRDKAAQSYHVTTICAAADGSLTATNATTPSANNPLPAKLGDRVQLAAAPTSGKQLVALAAFAADRRVPIQSDQSFVMPDGDVKVYAVFSATTPPAGSFPAVIRATGGNDALNSTATLTEVTDPANTNQAVAAKGKANAISVAKAKTVRVTAQPDPAERLAELRLTVPEGKATVPLRWIDANTAEFTMPAYGVTVEARFTSGAAPTYTAQVVVNNGIHPAGNTAALRLRGNTGMGTNYLTALAPGQTLELVTTVTAGYQLGKVLMVPQGGNTPLTPLTGKNQDRVLGFAMPPEDVIIYVFYELDPATARAATLTVENNDPAATAVRAATIDSPRNAAAGQQPQSATNLPTPTSAIVQAAEGETVTVKFGTTNPDYVERYSVTRVGSGTAVAATPIAGGFTFPMPAAEVAVKIVYTQTLTRHKVTLHVTDSDPASGATVTVQENSSNKVTWTAGTTGAQFFESSLGKEITVETDPLKNGFYVMVAYATCGSEMLPFEMTTEIDGSSKGKLFVPAGDVNIYIELVNSSSVLPDPSTAILLLVEGPAGIAEGAAGSATVKCPLQDITVQSGVGGPNQGYIIAMTGGDGVLTVRPNSGYAVDSVYSGNVVLTPTATPGKYTFPLGVNCSIDVKLKASTQTGSDIRLHLAHQETTSTDKTGAAALTYQDPSSGNTYRVAASMATPASQEAVMHYVAGGSQVQLTVTPAPNTYVDAAYVLEGTSVLRPLTPGLEGSSAEKSANFTMPAGAADVYVYLRDGSPPANPFHNLVMVATDVNQDGNIQNSGANKVTLSSAAIISGEVPSDQTLHYFRVENAAQTVALHMVAAAGYAFAMVTASPSGNVTFMGNAPGPANLDYSIHTSANALLRAEFGPAPDQNPLTLTIDDGKNDGTKTNTASLTLGANTTADLALTSRSAAGASGNIPNVAAGTDVALKVSPDATATALYPWAALSDGRTTAILPLRKASGAYGAQFAMPATPATVTVHMADTVVSPTVTLHVLHTGGSAPSDQNRLELTYPGIAPAVLTATHLNAGADPWLSLPVTAGQTASLTAKPTVGYKVKTVTVTDAHGPVTLTGDLTLATDTAPVTATFIMPTGPVTVEITYEQVTGRHKLDVSMSHMAATTDTSTNKITVTTADAGVAPLVLQSTAAGSVSSGSFAAVQEGSAVTLVAAPGKIGTKPTEDFLVVATITENKPGGNTMTMLPEADGLTYKFPMPMCDATLSVTFVTGYKATLKVVGGAAGDKASMTIGGITQEASTGGEVFIDGLKGAEPITLAQTPTGGSEVRAVMLTNADGTVILSDKAAAIMQKQDITITVFFDAPPADLYVATVSQKQVNNDVRNTIQIENLDAGKTTPTPPSGEIWASGKAADRMHISFTTAPGVYVTVTAAASAGPGRAAGGIPVVQVGITGSGDAYLAMPTPGCNVAVSVSYETTKPPDFATPQNLNVTLSGHDGRAENALAVSADTMPLLTLSGTTKDAGALNPAQLPGTLLTFVPKFAPGYQIQSADLFAGGVTVDVTGQIKAGTMPMPSQPATLTVTLVRRFTATLHLAPGEVEGITMSAPGTPPSATTNGARIEQLKIGDTVGTVAPLRPTNPASANAYLRGVYATTASTGTVRLPAPTNLTDPRNFSITDENVDIHVIYDSVPDPTTPEGGGSDNDYAATVYHCYRAGSAENAANTAFIANQTNTGPNVPDYGTKTIVGGIAGDVIVTKVTLAPGYSALVTAADGKGAVLPLNGTAATELLLAATGEVTLVMPAGGAQFTVTFFEGYSATLKIPTAIAIACEMTAAGSADKVTTDGGHIDGLAKDCIVTLKVTAVAPITVDGVVLTTASGSTLLPPTLPAGDLYTFSFPMPDGHVAVEPIVSAVAPPEGGRFIATVNTAQAAPHADNKAQSIRNTTDPAAPTGSIWAVGVPNDQMELSFTTAPGVYATVTAVGAGPVPVLQIGTTGSGKAWLQMPAANVQVTITYSTTPPTGSRADFVSTGHGGDTANVVTVTHGEPPVTTTLTPTAGVLTDVTANILGLAPDAKLQLSTAHAATYYVQSVTLTLTGAANAPVITIPLVGGGATITMPTAAVTVTVTYAPGTATPRPYDPDGAADPAAVPPLTAGHLTAKNHDTLSDAVVVTVPVLSDGTAHYLEVHKDANGDGNPDAGDFIVDFRLYYTPPGGNLTELKQGTDFTVTDVTHPKVYPAGTPTFTGTQFTLTAVNADLKRRIADGGEVFLSATQRKNTDESAAHPESEKTQLILPGPGYGPKPYDPNHAATVAPALEKGWIGAVNGGGTATVTVPVLADHKGAYLNVPAAAAFKLYLFTAPDTYTLVPEAEYTLTLNPTAPTHVFDTVTYTGAEFTLTAKTAASGLGKLLDNAGADGTALFLTATDKTDPAKPGPESVPVPLVIPRYRTLSGALTAYAPKHPATLSLYAETAAPGTYETLPLLTLTLVGDAGDGLWQQDYAFKSSALADGKYRLVIQKSGHITYEKDLTAQFAAPDLIAAPKEATIQLFAGDVDGDGMVTISDRTWIERAFEREWTTYDFADNTSLAYFADLDGDGMHSLSDLAIAERHMGLEAADYATGGAGRLAAEPPAAPLGPPTAGGDIGKPTEPEAPPIAPPGPPIIPPEPVLPPENPVPPVPDKPLPPTEPDKRPADPAEPPPGPPTGPPGPPTGPPTPPAIPKPKEEDPGTP